MRCRSSSFASFYLLPFLIRECDSSYTIGCSCFSEDCPGAYALRSYTLSTGILTSGRSHYPGRPISSPDEAKGRQTCAWRRVVFEFQAIDTCGEMHTFA